VHGRYWGLGIYPLVTFPNCCLLYSKTRWSGGRWIIAQVLASAGNYLSLTSKDLLAGSSLCRFWSGNKLTNNEKFSSREPPKVGAAGADRR
jgi:hypothetical protein